MNVHMVFQLTVPRVAERPDLNWRRAMFPGRGGCLYLPNSSVNPTILDKNALLGHVQGGGLLKHWRSTPERQSFCISDCSVKMYLHNAGIHVNSYIGFIAFQGDCIAFQGVFLLLFRVILECL